MIFIRISSNGLLVLLLLAAVSLPAAAQDSGKEPPDPKPEELVWPAPPDPPRVRFERAIVEEGAGLINSYDTDQKRVAFE